MSRINEDNSLAFCTKRFVRYFYQHVMRIVAVKSSAGRRKREEKARHRKLFFSAKRHLALSFSSGAPVYGLSRFLTTTTYGLYFGETSVQTRLISSDYPRVPDRACAPSKMDDWICRSVRWPLRPGGSCPKYLTG